MLEGEERRIITPKNVTRLAKQGKLNISDVYFNCGGPGTPDNPISRYEKNTNFEKGELVPAQACLKCGNIKKCQPEVYHRPK